MTIVNAMEVKVTGFNDLDKLLSRLPTAIQHRVMTQVIAKGARHIRDEARKAAPVRDSSIKITSSRFAHPPGHLRKGGIIMTRSPQKFRRKGVISLSVGFSKSGAYGSFLEKGTKARSTKKGWQRGSISRAPIIGPAFDRSAARAVDIMLTEGKVIIEKNIKKYIGSV